MNKLLIVCILSFSLLACGDRSSQSEFIPFESSKSKIPDTLEVGHSIKLQNINSINTDKDLILSIENAFGNIQLKAKNFIKEKDLIIPSDYTLKSGILNIELRQNNKTIVDEKFYLKPNVRVHSIENYFGQKFIHLDLNQSPEIVTFLLDQYDNTTNAEEDLKYELIQNQNIEKQRVSEAKHLAVFNFPKSQKVGKKSISVHYQNIHSEEESYYIMSGLPVDFSIKSKLAHSLADGNTLYHIETTFVKDQYGNPVSDGTQISFIISDEKGNNVIKNGSVIHGVAKIELVHPAKPNKLKIYARALPDAKSNLIELNFQTAIESIPISAQNRHLLIGPIVTKNQNYVPHSTEVVIKLYSSNKKLLDSWTRFTENGLIDLEIPNNIPRGNYLIQTSALGFEETLKTIQL